MLPLQYVYADVDQIGYEGDHAAVGVENKETVILVAPAGDLSIPWKTCSRYDSGEIIGPVPKAKSSTTQTAQI